MISDQVPIEQSRPRMNAWNWISIVVILVIIIAIAYYFLGSSSVSTVTTSKTLSLSAGQASHFRLSNGTQVYAIYLDSAGDGTASMYVGKVPVLANKISHFTIADGDIVNVSTEGGATADVEVKLISTANNTASVEIIYIPAGISVRTSPGVVVSEGSSIGVAANTTVSGQTTTAQATTTSQTTASSTTTVGRTTTVGLSGNAQALVDANASQDGILMGEFNTLYLNAASSCTASLYNTTYIEHFSAAPTGPNSYVNVSQETPTSLYGTSQPYKGAIYNVTYTATIPAVGPLSALALQVNITSNTVTSSNFEGAFQGETYTDLNSKYQAQEGIGNACAAYIP